MAFELIIANAYYPPFAPGGGEHSPEEMCRWFATKNWNVKVVTPCYNGHPGTEVAAEWTIKRFASSVTASPGQHMEALGYLRSREFHQSMTRELLEAVRCSESGKPVIVGNNFQSFMAVAEAARLAGVPSIGIVRDSQGICETAACLENQRAVDATPCRGIVGAACCLVRSARARQCSLGRALPGIFALGLVMGFRRTRFRHLGLQRLTHIVTISEALAALLHRIPALKTQTLPIIRNFRTSVTCASEEEVNVLLSECGLERGKFFLVAGKKSHGKGSDVAVNAMRQTRKHFPETRLLFVGKGRVKLTDDDGCVDRDSVTQAMVLGLLKVAAGLLIPGRWQEGMHRTLIDALYFGIPVVCTEAGAPPEYVQDGISGYVTPCNDPSALSRAMCNILGWPPQARETARTAAQKVFRTKFSDDVILNHWEHLFGSVWEKMPPSR